MKCIQICSTDPKSADFTLPKNTFLESASLTIDKEKGLESSSQLKPPTNNIVRPLRAVFVRPMREGSYKNLASPQRFQEVLEAF